MLIRLIYASQATNSVSSKEVRQILETSKANNAADHLTGMLCHAKDRFLQILEGERSKVNHAYSRIMQDRRHSQIVLLSYEDIASRLYPEWSMDYVSAEDVETARIIRSVTGKDGFTPETFSSVEAVELTVALTKRTTPQIDLE
jgi:hypothetical protein